MINAIIGCSSHRTTNYRNKIKLNKMKKKESPCLCFALRISQHALQLVAKGLHTTPHGADTKQTYHLI